MKLARLDDVVDFPAEYGLSAILDDQLSVGVNAWTDARVA